MANVDNKNNSNNNNINNTSKINPEIKYIIENTTKYKYFQINTNKYNNCAQPYFPYGAIFPISIYNSNSNIYNGMEEQNKNKCNKDNIKLEKNIDLYQETNSMSHLSTASEGEQGINSNYNNYYFYKSFSEEQKTNKKINLNKNENENKNIYDSIKNGIMDISNYLNSNKNNAISLSCFYHCDFNMDEEDKLYLNNKIQNFVNDSKK